VKAGADVLFVEAPQSRDELQQIAKRFSGIPLFANIIEGGKTPNLTLDELDRMGYKLAAFALSGLFSATKSLLDCFHSIQNTGSVQDLNQAFSFEEFKQLIRIDKHIALEARFRSTSFNS
jgi:methylisocitrate lyase